MITIAIANQKGGVAKTTTALCLANGLQECGYKVLMIDMDPQCNTSSTYRAIQEDTATLYDFLHEECSLEEAIQTTDSGDIVSGDNNLAGIEGEFAAHIKNYSLLRKALKTIEDRYDFTIIDTPPNIGFYMTSALVASSGVIIPLKAEKFAIDGLAQIMSNINDARDVNPQLEIYGVLLTVYDKRTALDSVVHDQLPEIGKEQGFKVFKTAIRTCQQIKEAQSRQVRLFDEYPNCNAAIDYANLIKELLEEVNK
ncbi:MAG: ParA family protein [Lachnospiraceae bacterium]|nr:ParA family protein [Lachnospiraceae bacterium]